MDWPRRQLATSDALLASLDELVAETGEDRDELEADLLEERALVTTITARRLIVAQRR